MCLVWECRNKCGNYSDSGNEWEQAWFHANNSVCAWCETPPEGWTWTPPKWNPRIDMDNVPEEIRWMYRANNN